MKIRCMLFLLLIVLIPAAAFADAEYDFNVSCWDKTAVAATMYSVEYVYDEDGNEIAVYTPIGTIPAGTYTKGAHLDKANQKVRCTFYLNGSCQTAWIDAGCSTDAMKPVWLSNSSGNDAVTWVSDIIVNNPASLAKYMAEHYPGKTYWLVPPYMRDESTTPGATPAPESPTDKPASTDAPAATKKPSDSTSATKKPMTTKKAKATATPAPTEVPAPEAWLSADWLAENVDADCTDRREVGIIRLGVVDSDVTLDGVDYTVPTDALTFAKGVKDKHRIAAIYAPRTGRCILRAKASEKAKELDKCPAGTIVPVLEYGKSWTKIRYDGQIGYVKTSVLTFLGDKGEPIGTGVTSYQGKATGNAQVPVRNGKTSEAEIIVNLRTATEVTVLSFDGKWYEIDHDGWYGFLYKSYFMFDDE